MTFENSGSDLNPSVVVLRVKVSFSSVATVVKMSLGVISILPVTLDNSGSGSNPSVVAGKTLSLTSISKARSGMGFSSWLVFSVVKIPIGVISPVT